MTMAASNVEPIEPYLEPLCKSVTVSCSVEHAFEVFTGRIGSWWPLAQYSVGQDRARDCAIEPKVGGEVYEVRDDGERAPWGRVLAWEPPRRFAMTWHPGREADTAQEVEVRFEDTAEGTRVQLEHRGWAVLGEKARETRESYSGGWDHVFGECFAAACGREADGAS
jgi:uncharacterized protein YndB with AHSA1/START domain